MRVTATSSVLSNTLNSATAGAESILNAITGMIMSGGGGREDDDTSNLRDAQATFGADFALPSAAQAVAEQRAQRQRVPAAAGSKPAVLQVYRKTR